MLKANSGVGPLLEDPANPASVKYDDREKTSILAKQFRSVFTDEPDGDIPRLQKRTEATLSDLRASPETVLKKLKDLNVSKSCGPDDIPPRLLRALSEHICEPIAVLFNCH